MSVFTTEANPTVALNTKAKNAATARAQALAQRQAVAVSSFRSTVDTLRDVNAGLDEDIAQFNELIAFYTEQKNAAEKAKADNTAIAENILKIIGE